MGRQVESSAKQTIAYGLLAAGIGLFYLLYAVGTFGPVPHRNGDDPSWLGFVFGLIFLFGGTAVVMQAAAKRGSSSGEGMPATTPPPLKLIYHAMAFAIVGLLGILFSWVAFAPGPRHFTGSGSIFGETAGRIMFGVGAVLVWFILIAIVISGVRRLLARE